jgi:hypothetical protein
MGGIAIPQNGLIDHVAALDTTHRPAVAACPTFLDVQIHVVIDKKSPTASATIQTLNALYG